MYKYIKLVIYLIFFNFIFCQVIYHDSYNEIPSQIPFTIDVLTDFQDNNRYISYNLFYKIDDQLSYFQQPMLADGDGYYKSTIPANHIASGSIEYFVVLEMDNGQIISLPESSPEINPYILKIIDDDYSNQNTTENINFLKADVTILSPLPYETVLADDLVISLSYFQLNSLDLESIDILLDDINVTNRSSIKTNHLIIEPPMLNNGRHNIKIIMKNKYGISFEPIIWTFNVVSDIEKIKTNQKFKYNGRVWSDYLNNTVDSLKNSYSTINFNFNGNTEWINFTTKLKKSSLENNFEQSKDRFLFKLDNKYLKVNYGDFYPKLGDYGLNGNRVRGLGLVVDTKYFQMHLINGELNRSINGNPNDGSIIISDFSDVVDVQGNTETMLTLSKDNYTFQRDLSGIRIAFGNKNKANFGLNIIKAKDNINSLNNNFSIGANISLDKFIEYYEYNSDQFIDVDGNGIWTLGEDILHVDYNNNGFFDDIINYSTEACETSDKVTLHQSEIIDIGTYIDEDDDTEIPIKQHILTIEMIYENQEELVSLLNDIFPGDYSHISISELSEQWAGNKPEDNFVIGTDMKLNFNNLVRIKSGIAMSLKNTNTWNAIKTVDDFDTYGDDFEDCYYARTYSNDFPEGYYWEDCVAYNEDGSEFNGLIIEDSGIALSDIPNPEDFADIIHFNFDSVPLIPFYSIIQKQQNNETITLEDIFNSPEIAFNLDFILTLNKQKVQFGIKQIGTSFNSLGNPYLQKDSRKKYFNNTLRFFKNKLFINFKWENMKNGLVSGLSSSKTDKYDINFSIYPGINLPSISMGYGIYDKLSGEASSLEFIPDDFNDTDDSILDELSNYDSRLNTKTTNINFTLSQSFKINKFNNNFSFTYFDSDKEDQLFSELNENNDDYISPRSKSTSTSLNMKTIYNVFWSSNIYITNNYFDFAQKSSLDYYQEQDFTMLSVGFDYSDGKMINKITTSIDYSISKGSTNYKQYGIRLLTKLKLIDSLNLILDFNKKLKFINSDESETKYSNSIFKVNLSYKF